MDLHLHIDGLELNNSEFKGVGVDIEENKRQSRRNIRINKAIMVYLQRHAKFDFKNDDYLVFLDVSGYTGAIVYLRRYEDIHVSGLLSRVAIKLPVDEKGLKAFLSGQSLGWLFTYVSYGIYLSPVLIIYSPHGSAWVSLVKLATTPQHAAGGRRHADASIG
ncbi:hypothetical protein F5H01DRAFT_404997 [Linnemannia elongata]|nr:hypothetical protein F5H01DRAFT_404997 [Linnemannia elongata]